MPKEFIVHASNLADMSECRLIEECDTIEQARAIVAAGDPQKFHTIIDRCGYAYAA